MLAEGEMLLPTIEARIAATRRTLDRLEGRTEIRNGANGPIAAVGQSFIDVLGPILRLGLLFVVVLVVIVLVAKGT